MIELAARRRSRVRWSRYVRISGGPRSSGDLRKWQANRTTCAIYTRCVFGVRLRICISSIIRRRSGLMDNSFAKWTAPHGAGASSRSLSCQTRQDVFSGLNNQSQMASEKRDQNHRITAKRFSAMNISRHMERVVTKRWGPAAVKTLSAIALMAALTLPAFAQNASAVADE